PSVSLKERLLQAGSDLHPQAPLPAAISSPQDTGLSGGEYCAIWLGPELPGDQREDDAQSFCLDAKITEDTEIVGTPVVTLRLSADRPAGMIAVRLCDVHPDGASTRITYGVLNLPHRSGHEFPEPVSPG